MKKKANVTIKINQFFETNDCPESNISNINSIEWVKYDLKVRIICKCYLVRI